MHARWRRASSSGLEFSSAPPVLELVTGAPLVNAPIGTLPDRSRMGSGEALRPSGRVPGSEEEGGDVAEGKHGVPGRGGADGRGARARDGAGGDAVRIDGSGPGGGSTDGGRREHH